MFLSSTLEAASPYKRSQLAFRHCRFSEISHAHKMRFFLFFKNSTGAVGSDTIIGWMFLIRHISLSQLSRKCPQLKCFASVRLVRVWLDLPEYMPASQNGARWDDTAGKSRDKLISGRLTPELDFEGTVQISLTTRRGNSPTYALSYTNTALY